MNPCIRDGKVIITGAASNAGTAIAMAFARYGCEQMVLGDGNLERLRTCRDQILAQYPSSNIHVEAFDKSGEEDVDRFFTVAVQNLTRIDLAVNVLSQMQEMQPLSLTGLSIELYDRNFAICQRGAFLIERALLRQMTKQDLVERWDCRGSIVNVVDYGPTPSLAEHPVIAAVANAIVGLSKTDACDYAGDKIRVNCVTASEVFVTKTRPEFPGGVPLPKKGTVDDVSNAVMWLSFPSSSWLTGLVVPVDGGRSLNHFW